MPMKENSYKTVEAEDDIFYEPVNKKIVVQ
jgi:hypothetical protein